MHLVRIAARILASMGDIMDRLTPEILRKYGAIRPLTTQSVNTNAPVFEDSEGRVVTFVDDHGGYMSAKNQMDRRVDSLPEVYMAERVDDIDDIDVYVIKMERLIPLSATEKEEYSPSAAEYWLYEYPGVMTEGLTDEEMENAVSMWMEDRSHPMFDSLTDLQKASVDLEARAVRDDVWQIDPHQDNVMWGNDGKLKYIDFGSIQYPNREFQSR